MAERMWVRVTGHTDDGYLGVLNNELRPPGAALSLGDRVAFRPDQVMDALPPESWDPQTRSYRD